MKSNPKLFLLIFVSAFVILGCIFFMMRVSNFISTPHPATSYEEALQKFSFIEKKEAGLSLSPEGRSRLMTHGNKTERVFVLLHGLSACPEQFVPLGNILFERGANVVILRARDAGYANIFSKKQNAQTGQDLVNQAAESLDIAAGLGNNVTIVGLSAGALGAAWMAEHRDGIDHALLIAPFFGAYGWPPFILDLAMIIAPYVPNFYIWKKDKNLVPKYVYPGYGTKCLASTLRLAQNVAHFNGKFKVHRLDILFSEADKTVNGELTQKIADQWAPQNPEKIFVSKFPASLNIAHDCVDPNNHNSKTALSYPVILKILNEASTGVTQ